MVLVIHVQAFYRLLTNFIRNLFCKLIILNKTNFWHGQTKGIVNIKNIYLRLTSKLA